MSDRVLQLLNLLAETMKEELAASEAHKAEEERFYVEMTLKDENSSRRCRSPAPAP
jgi:hypothetical protein